MRAVADDEVPLAGALVARAFHQDPLNVHVYPDEALRAHASAHMFEAFVRYDHLFGQVDRLEDFAAVASWQAPDDEETPERLARAGFGDLPAEVSLETLDAVFGPIGAATERAAPGPHWHLRLLAVHPARQGGGLGATLLEHGLRRAEASGHGVLLETFAERAVPFYRRHGFEVVVDDVEPASGLRYWVLRLPRRGSGPPALAPIP